MALPPVTNTASPMSSNQAVTQEMQAAASEALAAAATRAATVVTPAVAGASAIASAPVVSAAAAIPISKTTTITPTRFGLGTPTVATDAVILAEASAAQALASSNINTLPPSPTGGKVTITPTVLGGGPTSSALAALGTQAYTNYLRANSVSPSSSSGPATITGSVETFNMHWNDAILGPLGANTTISDPTNTLIGTQLPSGYLALNPASPLYSLSQVENVYTGIYPTQGSPSGKTNVSLGVIVDKNLCLLLDIAS